MYNLDLIKANESILRKEYVIIVESRLSFLYKIQIEYLESKLNESNLDKTDESKHVVEDKN